MFLVSSDIAYEYIWMAEIVRDAGINTSIIDGHHFNCNGINQIPKTFISKLIKSILPLKKVNSDFLDGLNIDRFVIFSANAMSAYLIFKHPNADIVLGEDGLGSYTGAIYERLFFLGERACISNSVGKRVVQLLNRIIFSRKLTLRPSAVFLRQPLLSCCEQPCEVTAIDHNIIWDEIISSFARCSYTPMTTSYMKSYTNYDVVYLGMPGNDEVVIHTRDSIIHALNNNRIKFIYRKHPREHYGSDSNSSGVWELRCINEINDNSLLLSAFSTAAFSPKMYFDKEPTLIFYYPILNRMGVGLANAEKLVNALRNIYSHKDRVIVVRSLQELVRVVKRQIAISSNQK